MSVAWVGAGIAATGMISSSMSSSKAASAQLQAADQASETDRTQYATTRADNAPWRDRGNQAGNRLQYLLGLDAGGGSTGGAPNNLTRDQLRNELLTQFTRQGQSTTPYTPTPHELEYGGAWGFGAGQQAANPSTTIDEAGLSAAIESRLAQQAQAQQGAQQTAQGDPAYGSLMRDFSATDLNADPVYQSGLQFGLDEGTKGLSRMASANGGRDSGALLKALTRFGNDYGSTKANDSYNRFSNNKLSKFNMLSGVAGTGQAATNQISAAGQNMANNVSQNQLAAGNSRAAGYIGQSNAVNNGISQGYNMYQSNQLMEKLFPTKYGVGQQSGVTGWNSQG